MIPKLIFRLAITSDAIGSYVCNHPRLFAFYLLGSVRSGTMTWQDIRSFVESRTI